MNKANKKRQIKTVKSVKKVISKLHPDTVLAYRYLQNALVDNIRLFLRKFKGVRKKKEIEGICQTEMDTLHTAYKLSTVHKHLTTYRNAVKSDLKNQRVKKIILDCLRLSDADQYQRNLTTRERRKEKNLNLAEFDLVKFIKKSRAAILSDDIDLITLGLLALTGRRVIEILKLAEFERVNNRTILFRGQAKMIKASRVNYYHIPVLDKPENIIKALAKVRQHYPNMEQYHNTTINSRQGRKLAGLVSDYLNGILEQSKHVKAEVKLLRAMYAEACFELFRVEKQKIDKNTYFAQILGHSRLDQATAQHYKMAQIKRERNPDTYEFKELL